MRYTTLTHTCNSKMSFLYHSCSEVYAVFSYFSKRFPGSYQEARDAQTAVVHVYRSLYGTWEKTSCMVQIYCAWTVELLYANTLGKSTFPDVQKPCWNSMTTGWLNILDECRKSILVKKKICIYIQAKKQGTLRESQNCSCSQSIYHISPL